MHVRAALIGQYHASLAMLKQAIEQCPDDLWEGGAEPIAFWRVAYHTLFFTHLYLQHHAALLAGRLRSAAGTDVEWLGSV